MKLSDAIADKKARLDRLRPLSPEALSKLEHYYDVEITYTSNAIEGNTLSAVETTLVIEQGVTIGGKPLKDHLEAPITTTLYGTSASWPAKTLL
jgi:Fic family protein